MRWQDINDLIKEVLFFKKRSRSRTLWIRGGVVTSFLGLLGWLSLLTGVTITTSGDVYCSDECELFVNITSTYYRIGLESFPMYFDDNVTYEVYVPARGKGNWRPIIFGKDFIERKNKYKVLPNRFKIIVHKNKWNTVKYGVKVHGTDIDPYLFAANIKSIDGKEVDEICTKVKKSWTSYDITYILCKSLERTYSDIKLNKSYSLQPNGSYSYDRYVTYQCPKKQATKHVDEVIDCIKTGKVNVSGTIVSPPDMWCKLIGKKVCCLSNDNGGQYGDWGRTDGSVNNPCKLVSEI